MPIGSPIASKQFTSRENETSQFGRCAAIRKALVFCRFDCGPTYDRHDIGHPEMLVVVLRLYQAAELFAARLCRIRGGACLRLGDPVAAGEAFAAAPPHAGDIGNEYSESDCSSSA